MTEGVRVYMVSYNHSRQLKNLRAEEKDMQEINQKFCQCCGMPLGEGTDMQGTNADGSKNGDYCKYCLDKGAFTFNGTMEEMAAFCAPKMAAANPGMTEEQAEKAMLEWFPTLKRWKK